MTSWPRITIGRMMAVVASLGLAFAGYRCAVELNDSTFWHGPNTSILPIGLEVQTCRGVEFGERMIPPGTKGLVVHDPPDEDSAYPDRLVGVRIEEGPASGARVEIKRTDLRAR